MTELAAIQQEEELRKRGLDLVSIDTEDPRLRAMLNPRPARGCSAPDAAFPVIAAAP